MPNGSKYYVWTLNNPTGRETMFLNDLIESVGREDSRIGYLCYGLERGESGTLHYQGYIEFKSRRSPKFVKDLLGVRCHIESRRGNSIEASDYCKKDGDYKEAGILVSTIRGWIRDFDLYSLADLSPIRRRGSMIQASRLRSSE